MALVATLGLAASVAAVVYDVRHGLVFDSKLAGHLAVVAGIAGAAWLFPVRTRIRSQTNVYVWGEVAFILGIYLVPYAVLIPATGVGVALAHTWRKVPTKKIVYNASAYTIGAGVGFVVHRLIWDERPTVNDWMCLGALALGATALGLVSSVLTAAAISAADGVGFRSTLVASLWPGQLVQNGYIFAALGVLALAQLRPEVLLLLPPALLALRHAHQTRQRLSEHEQSSQQLEEAIKALNALEVSRVLDALVRSSARLFRPDLVEIALLCDNGTYTLLRGTADGIDRDVPVRLETDESATVRAQLQAGDDEVGELRLRFSSPVQLSDHEKRSLSTLAGAASVALHNAQMHEQTAHDANHDPLTGLVNRRALLGEAEAALGGGDVHTALLLVDLDHFKDVNDTLGHSEGDLVLRQVADRLRVGAREGDLVARLGGDEFAVLLPYAGVTEATAVADRIARLLAVPASLGPVTLSVGGSIGVAVAPDDADTVTELLRCADVAMYQAKQDGESVARYDASRDPGSVQRLVLEPELRAAITGGQHIVAEFQPQIDLVSGAPLGVEALARWVHPAYGTVPPDIFLPVVERCGLQREFTRLILDAALGARSRWAAEAGVDLPVSVNLTARNLLERDLALDVAELLDRHDTPPDRLVLEIPETVVLAELDVVTSVLADLRQLGVQLSLDDFGTGGAPLTLLARVPLDEVKIDKSFVAQMHRSEVAEAIVRGTIDLAHALGLRVIAEGIEHDGHARALRELGCDAGQGFLYDGSMSSDDIPGALADLVAGHGLSSNAEVITMAAVRRR